MQGLFERNVHDQMQLNGFQVLGVDVMANRGRRNQTEGRKVWVYLHDEWPVRLKHKIIEYVLVRGHSDKLKTELGVFQQYVKNVLQVETIAGAALGGAEPLDLNEQSFLTVYKTFQNLLIIDTTAKEIVANKVDDIFYRQPYKPTEYALLGNQGDTAINAWMETTLQEWVTLFVTDFGTRDNFTDISQNFLANRGFNAYKSLPMIYNHMMDKYLISLCASKFHVVLCGSLARDELIALGSKPDDLLGEKLQRNNMENEEATFKSKHIPTRNLCLKLLLLYNFFPGKADEFVQMCLRKAYGLIKAKTKISFDGNTLSPNDNWLNGLFRPQIKGDFEKQLKEIENMDDFRPLCSQEQEADKDDLEYAHLVKGAMVNTDLRVVWAPEDESFLPRVDDEAFLNVMWNFIKKMVDDGLAADRNRWTAGDAQIMAGRIKYVKEVMRQAWVKSQNFQLSKEVVMAEDDILARLKEEQPFIHNKEQLDAKEFRKNAGIKKRWASAVGKRMLTQRLATRGRVSIMEHQRSAAWAEAEYKSLRCEVLKVVKGL